MGRPARGSWATVYWFATASGALASSGRAGVGSAVNDATRELGGTLGVAVVGSLFSSLYGARLVELLDGRLPGDQLRAAQDSVGITDALGAQATGVTVAMQDAFMSGLGAACLMIGLLCLAGAAFCVAALPGNNFVPPLERQIPIDRSDVIPN